MTSKLSMTLTLTRNVTNGNGVKYSTAIDDNDNVIELVVFAKSTPTVYKNFNATQGDKMDLMGFWNYNGYKGRNDFVVTYIGDAMEAIIAKHDKEGHYDRDSGPSCNWCWLDHLPAIPCYAERDPESPDEQYSQRALDDWEKICGQS